MPASRDRGSKVTFVYSNLYKIYKDGVAETVDPVKTQNFSVRSPILKAGERSIEVREHEPMAILKPRKMPVRTPSPAVDSLKKNLDELKDLHSRLRFMLKEIEDLIK